MFAGDSSGDCFTLHVAGSDLVRGVGYDLLGMQNPLPDQAPGSRDWSRQRAWQLQTLSAIRHSSRLNDRHGRHARAAQNSHGLRSK
jgi:hypothetical protein